MAALEVDLSKIEMGQTVTVKWRGKPVFVRRRSEQEVEAAGQVALSELRDPEPDSDRATNPEVGRLAGKVWVPACWRREVQLITLVLL